LVLGLCGGTLSNPNPLPQGQLEGLNKQMGDAMGDVIRARAAAASAVSRASELCDSLDAVLEGLRSTTREDSVVCTGLLFIHLIDLVSGMYGCCSVGK
jgi:hypothetical protein